MVEREREIEHSSPLYFNCFSLFCCSLWSQVVPEDASKLADFQKIIERTSQFEAALKELNFVSPSDAESRLSKYAEDVEVHFASRKKIEILAKARNLLLQCNFTIPQVGCDYHHRVIFTALTFSCQRS